MVWSIAGLIGASCVTIFAWFRSRMPGGFYDAHVYGMTPAIHRRYAAIAGAFALYFAATAALRSETAGIVGLAVFTLIAIFYITSFLQGFADEER